jgi:hypothetical protein
MHDASFAAAEQLCLSHDTPDPLVIDFPASTLEGFGHTTIAIASECLANLSNGLRQSLIVFLVS